MKGFLSALVLVLAFSQFGCRWCEPAPYYRPYPYYCQPCPQPCAQPYVQRAVVTPSPCGPVGAVPCTPGAPCTTVTPTYTTPGAPAYTPAPFSPVPSSPAATQPALPR